MIPSIRSEHRITTTTILENLKEKISNQKISNLVENLLISARFPEKTQTHLPEKTQKRRSEKVAAEEDKNQKIAAELVKIKSEALETNPWKRVAWLIHLKLFLAGVLMVAVGAVAFLSVGAAAFTAGSLLTGILVSGTAGLAGSVLGAIPLIHLIKQQKQFEKEMIELQKAAFLISNLKTIKEEYFNNFASKALSFDSFTKLKKNLERQFVTEGEGTVPSQDNLPTIGFYSILNYVEKNSYNSFYKIFSTIANEDFFSTLYSQIPEVQLLTKNGCQLIPRSTLAEPKLSKVYYSPTGAINAVDVTFEGEVDIIRGEQVLLKGMRLPSLTCQIIIENGRQHDIVAISFADMETRSGKEDILEFLFEKANTEHYLTAQGHGEKLSKEESENYLIMPAFYLQDAGRTPRHEWNIESRSKRENFPPPGRLLSFLREIAHELGFNVRNGKMPFLMQNIAKTQQQGVLAKTAQLWLDSTGSQAGGGGESSYVEINENSIFTRFGMKATLRYRNGDILGYLVAYNEVTMPREGLEKDIQHLSDTDLNGTVVKRKFFTFRTEDQAIQFLEANWNAPSNSYGTRTLLTDEQAGSKLLEDALQYVNSQQKEPLREKRIFKETDADGKPVEFSLPRALNRELEGTPVFIVKGPSVLIKGNSNEINKKGPKDCLEIIQNFVSPTAHTKEEQDNFADNIACLPSQNSYLDLTVQLGEKIRQEFNQTPRMSGGTDAFLIDIQKERVDTEALFFRKVEVKNHTPLYFVQVYKRSIPSKVLDKNHKKMSASDFKGASYSIDDLAFSSEQEAREFIAKRVASYTQTEALSSSEQKEQFEKRSASGDH